MPNGDLNVPPARKPSQMARTAVYLATQREDSPHEECKRLTPSSRNADYKALPSLIWSRLHRYSLRTKEASSPGVTRQEDAQYDGFSAALFGTLQKWTADEDGFTQTLCLTLARCQKRRSERFYGLRKDILVPPDLVICAGSTPIAPHEPNCINVLLADVGFVSIILDPERCAHRAGLLRHVHL